MSQTDDFFIRNQVVGGHVDLDEEPESIEAVVQALLGRPVKHTDVLEDKAAYMLWLVRQLGSDVDARQMAHEAATFREAGSALANLEIVIQALSPRPEGSPNRLFHSLANALALTTPDPMLEAMTGAAADNLRQDLATLDRIRSGLLRVQIAYSKANRGAAKGGAPRREMQAETLRGLANAYSGVMGSLPTVTIGGAGEGARGHFVEVVTVACQEAGKPGVFTESDFVTLRNGIKAKREQG